MAKPPAPKPAIAQSTATYKLKLWEIVETYQTISVPGAAKFPVPLVAFRIGLNRNMLKPLVQAYDDQVQAIQDKFTKIDPETKQKLKKKVRGADGVEVELEEWATDDMDGWNKEKRDLGNVEHEVTFFTFKLELLNKVVEVDQRFMNALVYMIEE